MENPIRIGDTTLEWERGCLTSYNSGNNKIKYKYDDSGTRVEKDVNGTKTKYNLVGNCVSSEEITNGDKIEKIQYMYDSKDNVVSMIYNNTEYIYVRNVQGDILGLVDGNTGKEVVSYKYDSWGKLLSIDDKTSEKVGEKNPYK